MTQENLKYRHARWSGWLLGNGRQRTTQRRWRTIFLASWACDEMTRCWGNSPIFMWKNMEIPEIRHGSPAKHERYISWFWGCQLKYAKHCLQSAPWEVWTLLMWIMFYGVWTPWTGLEDDWDSISSQAGMRSRSEVCLNPVSSHRFLGGHLGNFCGGSSQWL